jgi:predicted kinase
VVCPDSIRGKLNGDEGDQSNPSLIFQQVAKDLANELRDGNSVCYDATNFNEQNRKMVNQLATQFKANIVWHMFEVPLDTLIHRQSLRSRKVPVDVITRQFNNLTAPTTGIIVKH